MTKDQLMKDILLLEEMSSKMMSVHPLLNIIGFVRIFKSANNSTKHGPLIKKYNEVMETLQLMESEFTPREFYGLRKRVMACKPQ